MTEELWFIGQQITNGLVLGSVYTLLAMGFSLTFGVLGLINASHGHLYMIGAFTTFQVISWWFGPQPGVMAYIAALIISVSLVSVVGRAIYLLGIKPIWAGETWHPLLPRSRSRFFSRTSPSSSGQAPSPFKQTSPRE